MYVVPSRKPHSMEPSILSPLLTILVRNYGFPLSKLRIELLMSLKKFKNCIENQTSKRIITLCTDNGTEYTSTAFQQLLVDSGIYHELTQYYTPQSNGIAERKNRSIVEMARCLCFQNDIPAHLWSEAI